MRFFILATAIAFAASVPALADPATSVKSGHRMCRELNSFGMGVYCRLTAAKRTVVLAIDSNYQDNRRGCAKLGRMMRHAGLEFDSGWTLVIKNTVFEFDKVASCPLWRQIVVVLISGCELPGSNAAEGQ